MYIKAINMINILFSYHLNLDLDLLSGFSLSHGSETFSDGVELNQTSLVGLEVLLEVVKLALDDLYLFKVITDLCGKGYILL